MDTEQLRFLFETKVRLNLGNFIHHEPLLDKELENDLDLITKMHDHIDWDKGKMKTKHMRLTECFDAHDSTPFLITKAFLIVPSLEMASQIITFCAIDVGHRISFPIDLFLLLVQDFCMFKQDHIEIEVSRLIPNFPFLCYDVDTPFGFNFRKNANCDQLFVQYEYFLINEKPKSLTSFVNIFQKPTAQVEKYSIEKGFLVKSLQNGYDSGVFHYVRSEAKYFQVTSPLTCGYAYPEIGHGEHLLLTHIIIFVYDGATHRLMEGSEHMKAAYFSNLPDVVFTGKDLLFHRQAFVLPLSTYLPFCQKKLSPRQEYFAYQEWMGYLVVECDPLCYTQTHTCVVGNMTHRFFEIKAIKD
jgi:hypothetical protein